MGDKAWILGEFQKGRELSVWDCITERGCTRPAARIHELRKEGHNIVKRMVEATDRNGEPARFAKYRLEGDNVQMR